jgi:hypothetical protein
MTRSLYDTAPPRPLQLSFLISLLIGRRAVAVRSHTCRSFVAKESDAPRDHGRSACTQTPLAWGVIRCLSRFATVRRKDRVCFAALSNPRQGWGACTPQRGSWRAHILDLSVCASPHLSAAVTFSGSTVRPMRPLRGGEG